MGGDTETVEWEALVALGRVARAQGRRGELAVDAWCSAPERFLPLARIYVDLGDSAPAASAKLRRAGPEPGGRRPVGLDVESVRIHKGRPIVKFARISDIGAAEALRGRELRVRAGDLEPLPEGSFYQFQIQGLTVNDRIQGEIGTVESVLETGGTDVLVVRGRGGEETLVPLCGEIVKNIDALRGSVDIDAPEGLVSLNAN